MKEQKGKVKDQIVSTHKDLQKSQEQCNWLQGQIENFQTELREAREKIKLQENDKAYLAHKVFTAEEER